MGEAVIKIPVIRLDGLAEARISDQAVGLIIEFEQLVRSSKVRPGEVLLPLLRGLCSIELLAQGCHVIGRYYAVSGQDIDGVGARPCLVQGIALALCQGMEIGEPPRNQLRRHGITAFLCLGQEVHGVHALEVRDVGIRGPEPEGTLGVLTGAQHANGLFKMFRGVLVRKAEFRPVLEYNGREGPAHELFRAGVGELAQIRNESMRDAERQRRGRDLEGAQLRIHSTRHLDNSLVVREGAALDNGRVRHGRPDARIGGIGALIRSKRGSEGEPRRA